MRKARRPRFIKPCDNCGTEHSVTPSDIERGAGKTCSKKCRYELAGKSQQRRTIVKCAFCNKNTEVIISRDDTAKYCSRTCRDRGLATGKIFICKWCAAPFYRAKYLLSKRANKFCSHACQGKYHSGARGYNYKGGSINNGYRRLNINGKTIYEHQFVAQKHMGRKLLPNENVHHKDGDKLNNHISNLLVLTDREHTLLHQRLKSESLPEAPPGPASPV